MTTAEVLHRAAIRRGKRMGTVEMTRCVLDLRPGDRVCWSDGSRQIGRIEKVDHGHLVVHFIDAKMLPLYPCSRYRPDGVVQVLELTAEAPLEVAA